MEDIGKVTVRFTEPKMPGAEIPKRKSKWFNSAYGRPSSLTAKKNSDCPRCCAQILQGDTLYRQYDKWVCGACKGQALR